VIQVTCWATPVGPISAVWQSNKLSTLSFGHRVPTITRLSAAQTKFGSELLQYFSGKRRAFSGEFFPKGTPFQQKVWKALQRIPYGETRTYAQIAKAVGKPAAHRAVGNAVGKNPLPVLIPCHRVVRSDGELGGFSGGVEIKPLLLALEGVARFIVVPAPDVPTKAVSSSSAGSSGKAVHRRTKSLSRLQSKARSSLPSHA
jgi:methylated-DNA-[protein]-cysteine S-methyltransferase